jgi:hydroxymethylpyrimidine/phosphomethylpyrimidine kinase
LLLLLLLLLIFRSIRSPAIRIEITSKIKSKSIKNKRRNSKSQPVALTIAGSDSGGGAGIQADLKTFAALGVYGTCAVTCITAQNPKRVRKIDAISPGMVRAQIEAVFEEFEPAACKTGMLYSAAIIREVTRFFRAHRAIPLIVDPVMVATSGKPLLQPNAVSALKYLLRLASLVTPNLHEASFLLNRSISNEEQMREAAKEIHAQFGCAVLVKGGHVKGSKSATDIFFDGTTELLLTAPYISGVATHGTGCTCSAAIVAYLSRSMKLPAAVQNAKKYISDAIVHRKRVTGGHQVLNALMRKTLKFFQ